MFQLFSVMDKLPPVSYIRLVDIWLITVQLIPFLFVISRTLLELFTEQEEINHHGKNRKVGRGWMDDQTNRDKIAKILGLIGKV